MYSVSMHLIVIEACVIKLCPSILHPHRANGLLYKLMLSLLSDHLVIYVLPQWCLSVM